MQVEILACTPNFLKVIWCAARTCYSQKSPLELWDEAPGEEEMLRLVRRIFASGHHSVIEHCSITYGVSGVSRTLLAQYSRHRIGVSLSVQSQRYVPPVSSRGPGELSGGVIPPSIAGNDSARREFENLMRTCLETYDRLKELNVPKEDARFVLPGAAATNFVTTVNLRSLLHLYETRVRTPGAQWEIRELIETMVRLVSEREPWLVELFPEADTG